MPLATRLTTSEIVIRIPRRQARPPMIPGSNVTRSNSSMVLIGLLQPQQDRDFGGGSQCDKRSQGRRAHQAQRIRQLTSHGFSRRGTGFFNPCDPWLRVGRRLRCTALLWCRLPRQSQVRNLLEVPVVAGQQWNSQNQRGCGNHGIGQLDRQRVPQRDGLLCNRFGKRDHGQRHQQFLTGLAGSRGMLSPAKQFNPGDD